MATDKVAQTYRLTDKAHQQLRQLSSELGISQAAVVELATREYFEKHLGGGEGRKAS